MKQLQKYSLGAVCLWLCGLLLAGCVLFGAANFGKRCSPLALAAPEDETREETGEALSEAALRSLLQELDAVIDGILFWKESRLGVTNRSELLHVLSPAAGTSPTDWYAAALLQDPSYTGNTEAYMAQLLEVMKNPEPTDVEQYRRLLLWAWGGNMLEALPKDVVSPETLKDKGILSLVYELKYCAAFDLPVPEETLSSLLESELPEGGFALSGNVADIDVTAMTLQALLPYKEQEAVRDCIHRILVVLSRLQREDGSFASYGTSNTESTAQVILALCASQEDVFSDAFVKEGNTLWDGLKRFQLESGGFAHMQGGAENEIASAQALYACVMLRQNLMHQLPEHSEESTASTEEVLSSQEATQNVTQEGASQNASQEGEASQEKEPSSAQNGTTGGDGTGLGVHSLSGRQIKAVLLLLVALLGVLLMLSVFLGEVPGAKGERPGVKARFLWHKSRLLGILVGWSVLLVLLALFLRVDSVSEFALEHTLSAPSENQDVVYLSIDTRGEQGFFLEQEAFVLQEGDTVFSLLQRVTEANGISLAYQGGTFGSSVYVQGIGGLFEFEEGALSGWMFRVNGVIVQSDCESVTLSPGDVVEWIYTRNLGEDVAE